MHYLYARNIGDVTHVMSANTQVVILEVKKVFIRKPPELLQYTGPKQHEAAASQWYFIIYLVRIMVTHFVMGDPSYE